MHQHFIENPDQIGIFSARCALRSYLIWMNSYRFDSIRDSSHLDLSLVFGAVTSWFNGTYSFKGGPEPSIKHTAHSSVKHAIDILSDIDNSQLNVKLSCAYSVYYSILSSDDEVLTRANERYFGAKSRFRKFTEKSISKKNTAQKKADLDGKVNQAKISLNNVIKERADRARETLEMLFSSIRQQDESLYKVMIFCVRKDLELLEYESDIYEIPLFYEESNSAIKEYIDTAIHFIREHLGDNFSELYSALIEGRERALSLKDNAYSVIQYLSKCMENSGRGESISGIHLDLKYIFGIEDTSHTGYRPSKRISSESVASEDHLNREPLARSLMSWISEKSNSTNINVGLFGDWGSGKSTFIKLLSNMDISTSSTHILWGEFNAWRYEHCDNIQSGVTQETVVALKSQLGWGGRFVLTTKYAFSRNPNQILGIALALVVSLSSYIYGVNLDSLEGFTSAAIVAGVPVQLFIFWFLYQKAQGLLSHPLADKLNTYLRLPDFGRHLGTIPVMREQVALLASIRLKMPSVIRTDKPWWNITSRYRKIEKVQRLVFVVDDLDRCSPEGVVKTLEAIRLVMELDNVIVIVAVDQRVVLASLAKHYEDLEKHHLLDAHEIARDYLAKVIHIPIVLEQPSETDISGYISNNLWGAHSDSIDRHDEPRRAISNGKINSEIAATHYSASEHEQVVGAAIEKNPSVELESPSDQNRNVDELESLNVRQKPVIGLSDNQKEIFIALISQFRLRNPRQLKRLDNCYNLLRLRYRDEDEGEKYFRLYMLVWLEYLHEQPSIIRSHFLKDWEHGEDFSLSTAERSTSSDACKGDHSLLDQCFDLWRVISVAIPGDSMLRVYREVRCFILPAVNYYAAEDRPSLQNSNTLTTRSTMQ
jgi:hypothetical protein